MGKLKKAIKETIREVEIIKDEFQKLPVSP
jgi:hypothetical protein